MCTIERYNVVYPDGTRQTRERVRNCPRGTPTRPCSTAEIVPVFEDQYPTVRHQDPALRSEYHPTTPQGSDGSRSRPSTREKPKSVFDELALTFKFFNPFSSKHSKKSKKKLYLIRKTKKPESEVPAIIHHYPRAPTPPPSRMMPRSEESPVIVPIEPRRGRPHSSHGPQPRHIRERPQRAIVVEESSSEDDTPSPPVPARDHERKSRSISPRSRHEAEKRLMKEKEKRHYAERVAKEEEQARKRAIRIAELERLEKEKAIRERIEYKEKKRLESADRARRRQEREDSQRAQAQRRQELEDLEALNAAERLSRRQREQERRQREEHERQRQEEEDRLARARRANIPRRPRHPPTVHQPSGSNGGMEDRGERFIREAIRQENLRQFETEAPPRRSYRTYDDARLERRNTIGGNRGWRERRGRQSD